MNWISLNNADQLDDIRSKSFEQAQVIFKHSTRCSISSMVKNRLDRATAPANISFHFLDLIKHRQISNKIEADFLVNHESPQVLIIRNGECVYDESHNAINMDEIAEQAA
jgi:bacillithiol system protein YtxJ